MARVLAFLVPLALWSGLASASATEDPVALARDLQDAGDQAGAFAVLMELAEAGDLPFADQTGAQVATGEMLEAALIEALPQFSALEARAASRRFLRFVRQNRTADWAGFATGHGALGIACSRLGDIDCKEFQVSVLCENRARFASPMDGSFKYAAFTNDVVDLLNFCGEVR